MPLNQTHVLFVCLGNICRSPLAEALFLHHANKLKLQEQFFAESAGTSNLHVGEHPDSRTLKNASQHGIHILHKGRQFNYQDFERYDLIVAMDQQNLRNILKIARSEEDKMKVNLLRNFDLENPGADVPDPWFGGEAGFEEVFQILNRSTKNLLDHLKNKNP